MEYIECPHCGHENQITEAEEEPTCELCDGDLYKNDEEEYITLDEIPF